MFINFYHCIPPKYILYNIKIFSYLISLTPLHSHTDAISDHVSSNSHYSGSDLKAPISFREIQRNMQSINKYIENSGSESCFTLLKTIAKKPCHKENNATSRKKTANTNAKREREMRARPNVFITNTIISHRHGGAINEKLCTLQCRNPDLLAVKLRPSQKIDARNRSINLNPILPTSHIESISPVSLPNSSRHQERFTGLRGMPLIRVCGDEPCYCFENITVREFSGDSSATKSFPLSKNKIFPKKSEPSPMGDLQEQLASVPGSVTSPRLISTGSSDKYQKLSLSSGNDHLYNASTKKHDESLPGQSSIDNYNKEKVLPFSQQRQELYRQSFALSQMRAYNMRAYNMSSLEQSILNTKPDHQKDAVHSTSGRSQPPGTVPALLRYLSRNKLAQGMIQYSGGQAPFIYHSNLSFMMHFVLHYFLYFDIIYIFLLPPSH